MSNKRNQISPWSALVTALSAAIFSATGTSIAEAAAEQYGKVHGTAREGQVQGVPSERVLAQADRALRADADRATLPLAEGGNITLYKMDDAWRAEVTDASGRRSRSSSGVHKLQNGRDLIVEEGIVLPGSDVMGGFFFQTDVFHLGINWQEQIEAIQKANLLPQDRLQRLQTPAGRLQTR